MVANPTEKITLETAEAMRIATTGQWGRCKACLQAKAERHAVPKMTDKKTNVKRKWFYADVGGAMKHPSLGGNNYMVIFVDDHTRFEVVKFNKKKRDTTVVFLSITVYYITPQKLSITCIRTDNGGEFG